MAVAIDQEGARDALGDLTGVVEVVRSAAVRMPNAHQSSGAVNPARASKGWTLMRRGPHPSTTSVPGLGEVDEQVAGLVERRLVHQAGDGRQRLVVGRTGAETAGGGGGSHRGTSHRRWVGRRSGDRGTASMAAGCDAG